MELRERIDIHTHYIPPAYNEMLMRRGFRTLDGGMPRPDWQIETHLRNMEELGILKAYLSVSSPHLHMGDDREAAETARACNEFGAELAKDNPGKIGIMASLPLPEIEASIEEIRYCSGVLDIRSFCLMTNSRGVYLGDPALDPVMEELDRVRAVVSLHPTKPGAVPSGACERLPYPLMEFFFDTSRAVMNMILHHTIEKYPDIRFIVPHAGAALSVLFERMKGLPSVLPDFRDMDVQAGIKDLYYDLAGMVFPTQYAGLQNMNIEPTHLLYGSDSVFTPQPLCRKLAEEMDRNIDETITKEIYLNNPRRLFQRCGGA